MAWNQDEFYMLKIARIIEVRIGHSEITTDRRLFCDIDFSDGKIKKDVMFSAGGFDLITSKPHGTFFPPVVNQMVGVLFLEGSYQNPVCCFPLPTPKMGQGVNENKYYNLLTDKDDAMIAHKSGSKIYMSKNGDITVYGKNNSAYIKIDSSSNQVNINGNLTVDL